MMAERFAFLWDELVTFRLNGSTEGGSFGLRYELNISGLRAFLESPIVGHGFAERMSHVFANGTPGGPDVSFLSYVHNDYVTHMVAYGAMGLVFLAAYFVLTARLLLRLPDEAMRHGGLALLAMLAVYMNADVGFNMDPLTSLTTLLLGMALARPQPLPDSTSAQDGSPARP
jgi:O-antigen ligase